MLGRKQEGISNENENKRIRLPSFSPAPSGDEEGFIAFSLFGKIHAQEYVGRYHRRGLGVVHAFGEYVRRVNLVHPILVQLLQFLADKSVVAR